MNKKIETFYLNIDGEKQISPNFKVKEFRSKCGSHIIKINTDFVKNFLQKIREYFNRAVTVISAYRTEAHNAKGGGARSSLHLTGKCLLITRIFAFCKNAS